METIQKAAYFPEMLPGEAVYSVLARLRRHTGSTPTPAFASQFYGLNVNHHNLGLPSRIAILAARIPEERGLDALAVVRDHTLFNYYARFSAPQARKAALLGMLGGDGTAHKHLRLALTFPSPSSIRFCPECLRTMMVDHGEYYWRREHQLPSILVCPIHGCDLRSSTVDAGRHLTKLVPATKATCPESAPSVLPVISPAERHKLHELASDCTAILEGRDGFGFRSGDAINPYCRLLARKGLVHSGGRVRLEEYSELVQRELKHLRPIWPRLFQKDGSCGRWLRGMSHGDQAQDTTFILLGLRVAQSLPDGGRKQDAKTMEFGPGPWSCRNPLADHFGEATIRKPVFTLCNGNVTARFPCSCGYVYTQRRRSNGFMGKPRLHRFGETLRPILLYAIASGWTAGWTARQVGIFTDTLITEARSMGVAIPWIIGSMRKRRGKAISPDPKGPEAVKVRKMFIRAPDGVAYGIRPASGKSPPSRRRKKLEIVTDHTG